MILRVLNFARYDDYDRSRQVSKKYCRSHVIRAKVDAKDREPHR